MVFRPPDILDDERNPADGHPKSSEEETGKLRSKIEANRMLRSESLRDEVFEAIRVSIRVGV